jgi:Asp/Glu/hydantoin racemase
LHTGVVHVDTFTRLLAEAEPCAIGVHVLDESLLSDAQRLGTTDHALLDRIETRLRQAAEGSDAVLCTCSTLGAVAEAMSSRLGLPVVRVDRPMAAAAVLAGERIGIVASVESTMGPTRQLLEEEAEHQHCKVTLIDLPCSEAWEAFEAGDIDRYLTLVASHVDGVAPNVDVIVLAQASMAGAVDRCSTQTPVLTSPRAGVAAVVAASTSTTDDLRT